MVKLKKGYNVHVRQFLRMLLQRQKKRATIVQTVMSNVVTGKQCKPLCFLKNVTNAFCLQKTFDTLIRERDQPFVFIPQEE